MKPLVVKLVSMPFAPLDAPSLGLTQIQGVLRRRFGSMITVEIHYATFDFARYFRETSLYAHALSLTGFLTHFGEWFFAGAAFPEVADNTDAYLDRYDPGQDDLRRTVEKFRPLIAGFLDHVIDTHRLLEADVVGCTSMFLQNTASFALAWRLKERKPDLIAVMGGPACEGVMGLEIARRVPWLDFVFSGPALVSFPAFIGCVMRGDLGAVEQIHGVLTKTSRSANVGDEAEIDDFIPLDYEGFLSTHEEVSAGQQTKPYLLFETSRGCWWGDQSVCTFCGLNGSRPCHRAMSPQTAIRQLQSLYPFAKRARCFVATDNILPRKYPAQVFARLRPPQDFALKYESRVDLDFEALSQLQRARVVVLQPGIESLSTATLKRMHKGITAFQNLCFLQNCARLRMNVEWNLLIGTPGDPVGSYEKTLRDISLLHHLPPPLGAFPVMFVRFSRYHERPADYGLQIEPQEFYSYIYPFDPASVARIAAFFVNRAPEPFPLEPWLDTLNDAIRRWQGRWSGADGKAPSDLRLIADGKSSHIEDTRSGEQISYPVSTAAKRVLEVLRSPKSVVGLCKELGGSGIDVSRELGWLLGKSLLFEENGEYLSLVCGP